MTFKTLKTKPNIYMLCIVEKYAQPKNSGQKFNNYQGNLESLTIIGHDRNDYV